MKGRLLARIFGWRVTIIHGDSLMLDRWLWLRERLPETRNGEKVIDIGCGTGAFTIAAARRGYESLGISYDREDLAKAADRAALCKAQNARFEEVDIRGLHARGDLVGEFDVAICCEVIEHILDDRKLLRDVASCLKPGGRLLLTTPQYAYKAMREEELGPFSPVEDGGHVRRGYTQHMLEELCESADLMPAVSFCSGFLSQKVSKLYRTIAPFHLPLAWALVLPLRVFPPIFDRLLTKALRYPHYCVCLEAQKPRFGSS